MSDRHIETAAVRAGALAIPVNGASSPPLFQASSYEFDDLDDVEAIYSGGRPGRIYGRYGGPNGAQFEAAMAELEGAEDAVGSAAGMSAIGAAVGVCTSRSGTILATREIYGGTYDLFENDFKQRGFSVEYVDQADLEAVRLALERLAPKVLYLEALTNPLVRVADLPALAALGRAAGAKVIVDATFASPALIRPLDYGVDLVVHSVGKYLGGHADVGAGILAGSGELVALARASLVRSGASIPHFEAWLALRGLRTLALRMERHSENARAIAARLGTAAGVARVHHPSLAGHPEYDLARRLYPRGTGGILAFDLAGDASEVDRFLRGLQMISIVHSLGEVQTTISYPAVSSHRALPPETRRAFGISESTLRLSVGIEHADDIAADLQQALAGLGQRVRA